jgi:hypothetical protein
MNDMNLPRQGWVTLLNVLTENTDTKLCVQVSISIIMKGCAVDQI